MQDSGVRTEAETETEAGAGVRAAPRGGGRKTDGGSAERLVGARTSYLVKRLELAIRAELDRTMRPFDVTTPQYTALTVLRHHPGLSSAELARRSFVSAQAANEMVAALERKALIERRPGAGNRRVLEMTLTSAGSRLLVACDREVDEMEQRMLADLAPSEVRLLRAVLESCVSSLEADS